MLEAEEAWPIGELTWNRGKLSPWMTLFLTSVGPETAKSGGRVPRGRVDQESRPTRETCSSLSSFQLLVLLVPPHGRDEGLSTSICRATRTVLDPG